MAKWKCKECGYIYEGDELPKDFACPVCGKPASQFEMVEEDESIEDVATKASDAKADNKYAGTETEKNLMAAFAGESQARNKYTNTPILPALLAKRGISKLQPSLKKRPLTSATMLKCGSASWVDWAILLPT